MAQQDQNLHARLEALGHKIETAETKLREKPHLHSEEKHLTAKELKDRYRHLQARLNGEIADEEAHGRHVSDLERSVRQWLDSIDTTHVASN